MSKGNFYRVVEGLFLLSVIIGGIVLAFALAYDVPGNGAVWPVSPCTGLVWLVCAIVLSLTMISFLRFTGVSWFWSIVGGVLMLVMYSVFMTLLFDLMEAFMRGWLFG